MAPIRKLLVATDFSADSRDALAFAVQLAEQIAGEVTVLHVYHFGAYMLPDGSTLVPRASVVADHLVAIRDALTFAVQSVAPHTTVSIQQRSVEGIPHAEIARIAVDEAFDLVVMGSHGRGGLSRLILGSVTDKVLRVCHRPVVVVRSTSP
jgi:nucleotide-binding universal stress UspA family protein